MGSTQEDGFRTDLDTLRRALLDWYETAARPFPWRETTDPYAILVSEVMSQQTQLDRVIDPWDAFLDHWPTVEDLAAADRADVVAFWSTHRLGYNNRARYLHEAARQVVVEFDGDLPTQPAALETLQGVGPYTANAVASFAFNAGNAVVDTNVKRVLHRVMDRPGEDLDFERAANALLPTGQSRQWNNAMMELGGVVCRKTPRCDEEPCPWRASCSAYGTGDFTAPDVPTQPTFDGSRRQFRGRIIHTLSEHGPMPLTTLGPRVRVDFVPDGDRGVSWLRDLLEDLAADGLVTIEEGEEEAVARLRR